MLPCFGVETVPSVTELPKTLYATRIVLHTIVVAQKTILGHFRI